MAKRNPHSQGIAPQSGPDRRSLLMGTVSTAANRIRRLPIRIESLLSV
jgi:hypothetical protein